MFKNIKFEIIKNKLYYIILTIVLIGAFFVRTYRLDQLLGFYYDQGRDAKIIWDLWHNHTLFLIGPTTGLAGIFLGPFYYYLIAPFYLLGRGDPVWPATFLAFTSTCSVFLLYWLGWKMFNRSAGLIAATIGAFSYYLVLASRWLSNPTPLLLSSMILLLAMWMVVSNKSRWWWILIALTVGVSLHFEAASAVFYIPMIIVFAIWQRKQFPSLLIFGITILAFGITLLPQILFDLRHEHILFNNVYHTFIEQKSFKTSFWEVLEARKNLFWSVFSTKLLPGWETYSAIIVFLSSAGLFIHRKFVNKSSGITILLIYLIVPLIGFVGFQGNQGNVYDYYLTGLYLPFVLLFSLGLASLAKNLAGKFVIVLFLILFLFINGKMLKNYLTAGVDGPTNITLGNEVQAVDWVINDSNERPFNQDVYVPPVIPHSYNYLFLWRTDNKCGPALCNMMVDEQVPLLYTLYEVDPPHPERLEAWLSRQKGIGKVEETKSFGGITVERRHRI